MEGGHVAEVVGKVGDIDVVQLKVRSRLPGKPPFLVGARQPSPHAAARYPQPCRHALYMCGREQATSAQAEKACHSALPDLPAPGVAFGAASWCQRSYRLPLLGADDGRWVAARLPSAPDRPTGK